MFFCINYNCNLCIFAFNLRKYFHVDIVFAVATFKSKLVLPFWDRLSLVVLEKRPLNECTSSISNV